MVPRTRKSDVINLDSNRNSGTHWMAYFKNKDSVIYFDSFGILRPSLEVKRYFKNELSCEIAISIRITKRIIVDTYVSIFYCNNNNDNNGHGNNVNRSIIETSMHVGSEWTFRNCLTEPWQLEHHIQGQANPSKPRPRRLLGPSLWTSPISSHDRGLLRLLPLLKRSWSFALLTLDPGEKMDDQDGGRH